MKTYKVKVTTQSGYMIFTVEADNELYAEGIIKDRMRDAGWNTDKIEVVQ